MVDRDEDEDAGDGWTADEVEATEDGVVATAPGVEVTEAAAAGWWNLL